MVELEVILKKADKALYITDVARTLGRGPFFKRHFIMYKVTLYVVTRCQWHMANAAGTTAVASPRGAGASGGSCPPPTFSGVDFEISTNPVRKLVC